jgi:rhamnose transport system substrate-binding protein
MIRKTIAATAVALSIAAVAATLVAGPSGAAQRKYTVASFAYVQSTAIGGRAAAKRFGMRFIMTPHNPPPQEVIRNYESMIARHVDAIIADGYDPALRPILTKVRKARILLISSGDDIAAKRDLWVNYSAGAAFAPALADALASQIGDKGEYAILEEQGQFPVATMWEKEVQVYIPKAYPNMQLDGVLDLSGAGDQNEVDAVKSFMAAHPNLKGLLAITPTEEFMAAEAIQQAGRIGQIFSAGNGGTGNLKGTPLPGWIRSGATEDVLSGDPINLGYLTVWAAHYLLTGHHFRPGAYQVGGPVGLVYYYAEHQELRLGPPLIITKKNVDQYANKF